MMPLPPPPAGARPPMRFPPADTGALDSLARAWPVGSVFVSAVATNPADLLGFGVWAAFGAGRVLVGQDAGQAEFDTLGETGGAKTHTHGTGTLAASAHAGAAVADHASHTHTVATQVATPDLFTTNTGGTGVSGVTGGPSATEAIGSRPNGSLCWDGLIDEVGLWGRALTSGERTTLYNAGAGLAYPFSGGAVAGFVVGGGVGSYVIGA